MKTRKPKRIKKYKGCLKMSLDVNKPFNQLTKELTYYGQWITQRKQILSKDAKRQWYINIYITTLDGKKYVDNVTSPVLLNKHELNGLIDNALEPYLVDADIDRSASYLTVSC
ncbi:hypothetical protein [Moraxella sp. ZY200743]|uniref:hypothetical protein n=1 Tax=Moraxella sp. ZY200743 TaxID=2911970 RepID=UPI003D7D925B